VICPGKTDGAATLGVQDTNVAGVAVMTMWGLLGGSYAKEELGRVNWVEFGLPGDLPAGAVRSRVVSRTIGRSTLP
jgi:hypothetical protein